MSYIKKITSITAVFIMLVSGLSATGAGIQIGGNPGIFINEDSAKLEKFSATITGTMRLSRLPLAFGFGFEAGSYFSDFSYGLTGFADYYAIDIQLKNTWSFFSGFGAQASILTSDFSDWTFIAGPRFFLGANRTFYDNYLELFAQQNIVPSFSKEAFFLSLPLEAGIRMHF